MKFTQFMQIVKDEPVFPTGLLLTGDADPREVHRQLSRWRRGGKIYQLRRGLYCLAPPFTKVNPHPFLVANRMLPASYVSLQSALAYYGMIPEYVPLTTSVTTNRAAYWETPIGAFFFRTIQVGFFYGFHLKAFPNNQQAFIATSEKALLDLIYLESGGDDPDYLRELRLNNLNCLNWHLLENFVQRINKPKLNRAVTIIKELALEEEDYETL